MAIATKNQAQHETVTIPKSEYARLKQIEREHGENQARNEAFTAHMRKMQKSRDDVRSVLGSAGFSVTEPATVRRATWRGIYTSTVDIMAKGNGARVALEFAGGSATLFDWIALQCSKADIKIVVAEGWVPENLAKRAADDGITLVKPEDAARYLSRRIAALPKKNGATGGFLRR